MLKYLKYLVQRKVNYKECNSMDHTIVFHVKICFNSSKENQKFLSRVSSYTVIGNLAILQIYNKQVQRYESVYGQIIFLMF